MKLFFIASVGILVIAAMIFYVAWEDKRLSPVCPRCGIKRTSRRRHIWSRKAECTFHGTFIPQRG